MATAAPIIVEDVDAVIVELVGKEGVRDKELADRDDQNDGEGQNDHLDDHVHDNDEKNVALYEQWKPPLKTDQNYSLPIGLVVGDDDDGDIPDRNDDVEQLADEEYVGVGVELVVNKLEEICEQLLLFL